jgi:hypothetical protein
MVVDAEGTAPSRQEEPRRGWLWHLENGLSVLLLILIAVMPTAEILARWIFRTGVLGATLGPLLIVLCAMASPMTEPALKATTKPVAIPFLQAAVETIKNPLLELSLTLSVIS